MGMGQVVDYSQFILQIEKAIANGVATLDSNAKVPKNQIDLIASDVGAIAAGIGGASAITNVVTISRANYNLLTPNATTLYLILE